MKTLFDDYVVPEGIMLHDPSAPSALRMVFDRNRLIGQVIVCGKQARPIRRIGDSSAPYFDSVQEAIDFLLEHRDASG